MKRKRKTRLENVFADLAQLPDDASRKKFLSRHRQLLQPAVVEELTEAVRKYLRVDTHQALGLAEAALLIAQKLGDKQARARALRAKANTLWFLGQDRSAVELHEQAVRLFEEAGNTTEVGRTLSVSIQPRILLGEYDRALAAAERARAIFVQQGDAIRLARLEINLGNIYHRQDRFAEALACYQRAYEQLLPDKDTEGIAAALHNIAVCQISLNEFGKALATYERARQFCQQHEMPLAVAQADYNIAYLYYFRGQYARAIEMLRATRETFQKISDPYHAALCHLDLSEIYLDLNLSEEAAERAREAFDRFQQLGVGYEAAKALSNFAIALSQQEKGVRALELFVQARAMFVKEKNQVWPSLVDLYQSVVLYNEGRWVEARRLCLSALEFFRSSSLPSKTILCYLLLARLSLKMGAVEAARRECTAALEQLQRLEVPLLSYQTHFLMGQIEEAAQNLKRAYECYQTAREVLETLRSGLHREDLKIAFMKNRLEVYENLVSLCLRRGPGRASSEEAWAYIEEAKSRNLRDLVLRRSPLFPPSEAGNSELVRQIRELREQLNWYYHRIELEQLGQEKPSPRRLDELQALVKEGEKKFLAALRELPAAEAELTGFEPAGSVRLETIREVLDPDVTLVEYFRVRDHLLAALITRQELQIVPLTGVSRVSKLLRMLEFQLSKFRLGPDYVGRFQESLLRATQAHLQDLYQEVVAPARPLLRARHLVIVPHDLLHYLPFHALFDGKRYLADSFTISYAPSASIYAHCQRKQANTAGPSLILGVPDRKTPFILDEVQAVAAVLPSPELFLGPSASEQTLRERSPQSRFIHIATHGYFRQDNPMFSGVRLGGSHLNVYDLYQLKLPAELVTLSGCATGLNVVAAGDELLGLVRGLLYAGAQCLLLTLWDVHDRSTAEFMKHFYGHFRDGGDKALALQAAIQRLRERYPHPYYWAPFILVGKVLPSGSERPN